jgi:predicted dehydrogenase
MDVAIIGAGGIADVHLQNIDDIDDVNVVGVCDLDRGRAAVTAEPRDATPYTDNEELFAEETFDALFVHLPPTVHTDQVTRAAERAVDVFLEKPLPLSMRKARELGRAINDAGIVCQVGYMFRYADVVERARRLVEGRDLTLVRGQWFGGVPDSAWWKKRDRSGGQVVTTTTHVYDLARYFGGEATKLNAYGSQTVVTDEIDFADTQASTVSHNGGVVSQVASTCTLEGDRQVDLLLVGDEFRLALDFRDRTVTGTIDGVSVSYREPDREYEAEQLDYFDAYPFHRRNDYDSEIRAFFDAVRAGDPSLVRSDYDDAMSTHELTTAVNESLDSDEPVSL